MMGFAFANTCEHTFKQHGFFCKKKLSDDRLLSPPSFLPLLHRFLFGPRRGYHTKRGGAKLDKIGPTEEYFIWEEEFYLWRVLFLGLGAKVRFLFCAKHDDEKIKRSLFFAKAPSKHFKFKFSKICSKICCANTPVI